MFRVGHGRESSDQGGMTRRSDADIGIVSLYDHSVPTILVSIIDFVQACLMMKNHGADQLIDPDQMSYRAQG